eukprot:CAMPEP_0196797096 /NCGR_PEP_ID=MMETSP1104-20130614/38468_1 /TAXON_ID=33652 /ORGANISM="Cafeteria sp., Strain Caron Lab Isolate" /LENGTH=259 /DNA_ID=CAMNT_0042167497 /DNA_START=1004 /DNA_END=1780 /DNA_ORIENTATION=-
MNEEGRLKPSGRSRKEVNSALAQFLPPVLPNRVNGRSGAVPKAQSGIFVLEFTQPSRWVHRDCCGRRNWTEAGLGIPCKHARSAPSPYAFGKHGFRAHTSSLLPVRTPAMSLVSHDKSQVARATLALTPRISMSSSAKAAHNCSRSGCVYSASAEVTVTADNVDVKQVKHEWRERYGGRRYVVAGPRRSRWCSRLESAGHNKTCETRKQALVCEVCGKVKEDDRKSLIAVVQRTLQAVGMPCLEGPALQALEDMKLPSG